MQGQQHYGKRAKTPNAINIGHPIAYHQIGQQHQQQPIYYGINQAYAGGVYNQQQQQENVGQSHNYHQVPAIPGYSNNYQHIQNIQNQQPQNIYQQNQIKYIYPQQSIPHQQVQKPPMMNQQIIMKNQKIQQKLNIQNQQTHYALTNPNVTQKQVKNMPIVYKLPSLKREKAND